MNSHDKLWYVEVQAHNETPLILLRDLHKDRAICINNMWFCLDVSNLLRGTVRNKYLLSREEVVALRLVGLL